MPQSDRAAVGVNLWGIVRQAKLAHHRQRLGGERFVQFDDVHLRQAQPGDLQHLAGGRQRADAHQPRFHAAGGGGNDARARRQALACCHRFRGDDQRRRAVVQARGVAGGDAAGLTERGFQRLQLLEGGVGARVFILAEQGDRAFFTGEADRRYLLRQVAQRLRPGGALLAAQRKGVLIGAADVELRRDVFGGLRHRIGAELE